MTEQEIKNGITEVCETSSEIAKFYSDNNALVSKLNSVPQDELPKLPTGIRFVLVSSLT